MWTENAVVLPTPGWELKLSQTQIIDAQTGQINDSMPGLEQRPGINTDKVKQIDPIIKDEQLTCPDGFTLNAGADQCIPY